MAYLGQIDAVRQKVTATGNDVADGAAKIADRVQTHGAALSQDIGGRVADISGQVSDTVKGVSADAADLTATMGNGLCVGRARGAVSRTRPPSAGARGRCLRRGRSRPRLREPQLKGFGPSRVEPPSGSPPRFVKDPPEGTGKQTAGVRFGYQLHVGVEPAFVDDGVAGVAGGEEDGEARL